MLRFSCCHCLTQEVAARPPLHSTHPASCHTVGRAWGNVDVGRDHMPPCRPKHFRAEAHDSGAVGLSASAGVATVDCWRLNVGSPAPAALQGRPSTGESWLLVVAMLSSGDDIELSGQWLQAVHPHRRRIPRCRRRSVAVVAIVVVDLVLTIAVVVLLFCLHAYIYVYGIYI